MISSSFIVLGAGAWGTALAAHLAKHHPVMLWGHDEAEMSKIARERANAKFLPGICFPENLEVTSSLQAALQWSSQAILLIAVPSHAFPAVLAAAKPYLQENTRIVWATKGLSQLGELLHQVCQEVVPGHPLAVLSGPSFAQEVAKGFPTAVTIATQDALFGDQLLKAFHHDAFRVYLSNDLIGVQLGGVVKNVLAIAVGMSDGLGFGANARAALITRGLAELCRLGETFGAQLSTFMGLSGVGDMVLTCTDNQSRNRRFGLSLGQGKSALEAEQSIQRVIEGKDNAKQIVDLAKKQGVEMPICQQVYAVLYEKLSPQQAVINLLKRSPKTES